jgi:uncharacterized protein (TIGR00266 family)
VNIQIDYKPAATLAVVQLQAGETIRAESGAMVSMSSNVDVRTDGPMNKRQGGLLKGLKRSVLGGETFFTNTFTAVSSAAEVTWAPTLSGDMVVHELGPMGGLYIQGSSYVAAPDTVQLDTRFQGMKGLFSGESLFFLHATGSGPVIINAFGAIHTVDLDGELIVDTGHLVAFTGGIEYEVTKASAGWISSFLSGEGLVLRMRGQGRLYLQTRNPDAFGGAIGSRLPARQE